MITVLGNEAILDKYSVIINLETSNIVLGSSIRFWGAVSFEEFVVSFTNLYPSFVLKVNVMSLNDN